MPGDDSSQVRPPEGRGHWERIQRAVRLTQRLNAIPFEDLGAIREAWSELTGQPVDEKFLLIPPVYVQDGLNTQVGRNVFINQGCTFIDLGGIDIGDDVMIGPGVNLITSGHPLEPSARRSGITSAPVRLERNVWIGAGAQILQGVTVGADAVVAAGAVVTRDVEPATLVGGVPAGLIRRLSDSET
jgi:acetyltransferase-like isoleucine patch superfamily enzyme